jgi:uncharacterized surface protein with fasciclin (FAS1) repeats
MKRSFIAALLLIVALPVVLAACGNGADEEFPSPTPSPTPTGPNIMDTLEAEGDFSTLLTAIQAAGLEETFRGPGPYTLFAPPDSAFVQLPLGALDTLLADPQGALTDVLTHHVVAGRAMSTDLEDGMSVETINGAMLTVSIENGTVRINDAEVTRADIEVANGVIHIIDRVLIPPQISPSPSPDNGSPSPLPSP